MQSSGLVLDSPFQLFRVQYFGGKIEITFSSSHSRDETVLFILCIRFTNKLLSTIYFKVYLSLREVRIT